MPPPGLSSTDVTLPWNVPADAHDEPSGDLCNSRAVAVFAGFSTAMDTEASPVLDGASAVGAAGVLYVVAEAA